MMDNEQIKSDIITTKQFGDACEHYVVAMLGFANVPAQKMPDFWPNYDLIAQPFSGPPLRISVKGKHHGGAITSRAFRVDFADEWDWLAAVIQDSDTGAVQCWLLPRDVVHSLSTVMPKYGERRLNVTTLVGAGSAWEANYTLSPAGTPKKFDAI